MKRFIEKHPSLAAILFTTALAMGLNLFIEILGHRSLITPFAAIVAHPLLFLFNSAVILITLSLSELFPRRNFVLSLICLLWLILGVTNFVLLLMRNSPLCGVDFYILSTGFSIITVYLSIFQMALIVFAFIAAIVAFVFLYRKLPKGRIAPRPALIHFGTVCLSLVLLQFSVYATSAVPDHFDDMTEAYKEYGFVYCFAQTLFDRGIDEPEDFSEEKVNQILSSIDEKAEDTENTHPNVIVLQLESFFDLGAVSTIQLSENPIPYFTSLKNEYPSGLLTVPMIGGGTANTEFEVLTGMNLDYFGIGEYPYNSLLQTQTSPSLAYVLKEQGYTAHAMHNHEGSFYDRYTVYPNLGFDTFTSIEYMNGYEENELGWCDDSVLTNQILAAMDSTAGSDFVFAVSVQCHGKFPDSYESPEGGITVTGVKDEGLSAQYHYYADQLRAVDDFLTELTAALSVCDEPVVLAIYGDHLPSLQLTNNMMQGDRTVYQTEYVIWSNDKDLGTEKKDISTYQLGALALDYAGIHEGTMFLLHQTESENEAYESWMETLQYDILYGTSISLKDHGEYPKSNMQMGITPIHVEKVWQSDSGVYVFGSDFTKSSVVQINGKNIKTEYVSDTMLLATKADIDEGDKVTVAQISATAVILSKTNPLTVPKDFEKK